MEFRACRLCSGAVSLCQFESKLVFTNAFAHTTKNVPLYLQFSPIHFWEIKEQQIFVSIKNALIISRRSVRRLNVNFLVQLIIINKIFLPFYKLGFVPSVTFTKWTEERIHLVNYFKTCTLFSTENLEIYTLFAAFGVNNLFVRTENFRFDHCFNPRPK